MYIIYYAIISLHVKYLHAFGLGFGCGGPYRPENSLCGEQWTPDVAEFEADVLGNDDVQENFDCFPDSSWKPILREGMSSAFS